LGFVVIFKATEVVNFSTSEPCAKLTTSVALKITTKPNASSENTAPLPSPLITS